MNRGQHWGTTTVYYKLGLMSGDIGRLSVARCDIATVNMTMAAAERKKHFFDLPLFS